MIPLDLMDTQQDILTLDQADTLIRGLGQQALTISARNIQFAPPNPEDGNGGSPYVDLGSGWVEATPRAYRQILRRIGVTPDFVDLLQDDPNLYRLVIDHLRAKQVDPLRIQIHQNRVVAVEDPGAFSLGVDEVWAKVRDLPGIQGVKWVRPIKSTISLRVISDTADHPPQNVDDVSHAGIEVNVNGHVEVLPYVERLICKNGMRRVSHMMLVAETADRTFEQLRDEFFQCVDASWEISRSSVLRDFIGTSRVPVDNPYTYMLAELERLGIQGRARAQLLALLPTLPERPTVYDLVNLVTLHAQTMKKHSSRIALENFGGAIAEAATATTHRCSHCAHPIQVN